MLRIYDEFLEDEAVLSLKNPAYRLHVSALLYCSKNLTDGKVSDRAVKVLQAILGYTLARPIGELVSAGLWEKSSDGDGYTIRNYLEFNPPAATVKAEKAKARDRMRKLRDKRATTDVSTAHVEERSPERDEERNDERALQFHTSPYQAFELDQSSSRQFQGLPIENEFLCTKLLALIGTHADEGTPQVLRSYARKLTPAALARVAESAATKQPTNRARYVISALRDEVSAAAA